MAFEWVLGWAGYELEFGLGRFRGQLAFDFKFDWLKSNLKSTQFHTKIFQRNLNKVDLNKSKYSK